MKKLIAVAAMLVTIGGVASAQGGGAGGGGRMMTPEQRLENMMTRLFSGINLSEGQKTKATAIIKESMEGGAKIDRQSPEGMAKRQELNKKRNGDLRSILTSDEDRKKFDENVATSGRGPGSP